jgi:hypothetical protein
MLRPTYNFEKILGWLFIYGALIKYAEKNANTGKSFTRTKLTTVIKEVYNQDLAKILCDFLVMLQDAVIAQTMTGDDFGMRTDIDDKIINYQSFGHHFY